PITTKNPVLCRSLLCICGDGVRVFSAFTEECIHHLLGHTDLVTGLVLFVFPIAHFVLQVVSCLLDGAVRLWDHSDGILIKHNLLLMFQLVAVHLPHSGEQLVEAHELSAVLSEISANPGAISFRGVVCVFFERQQEEGTKSTFKCVTCHPKDDCIVTGHEGGQICLWPSWFTYTQVHLFNWHHVAVGTLCFTPQGTNFLSGGVESVLVQWRYNQETERDYLKPNLYSLCVCFSGEALVLNRKPGQRDKLLYNDYIHEAGLDQFNVVKADFDTGGKWLVTEEERKQNSAESSFAEHHSLVPHENLITDLSFSPDQTTLFVFTSRDGHFKAWVLAAPTDTEGKCCSGLAMNVCRFFAVLSRLGFSVLLLVTVWSLPSWDLLTTLSQPPGEIRYGQNILTGGFNQLPSVEWSTLMMDVTLLLADPLSRKHFCFQAGNSDLFEFKLSEPRPLFSQKAVCSGRVIRAVFVPRQELYYFTTNMVKPHTTSLWGVPRHLSGF
uniref:WD repeat domain 75 n=1 Tax=Neogobius melanostomus TaxID=47308 RepID=A0A8C6SR26_9GOBI